MEESTDGRGHWIVQLMPGSRGVDLVERPGRHPLEWCLVRVRAADDGRLVGAGFVVAEDWVCTCAHVVAAALGTDESSPDAPAGDLVLEAYRDGTRLVGQVQDVWVPARRSDDDDGDPEPRDVALVFVPGVGRDALRAARLVAPRSLVGRRFEVCGFPGMPAGVWAHGVLGQPRANQTLQIEGEGVGVRVQPGFSGAPVWDPHERGVVGMVVSAWRETSAQTAFVIPVDTLAAIAPARLTLAPTTIVPFGALTAGVSPRSPLVAFLNAYLGTLESPSPFGGRSGELEKLDRWLDGTTKPYMVVAAPAGRGKSALLTHWGLEVAESGRADVVFVPISLRFGSSQRADVERMIVDRLRYLIGDIAGGLSDDDVLAVLFQPLVESEQPLLVVFDAVDEASGWVPGEKLPLAPYGVPGVRAVASARLLADRDADGWLTALGWHGAGEAMTVGLLDQEAIREVLVTLHAERAADMDMDHTVDAIYVGSDSGDPLLVGLLAAAIGPGGFLDADQLPDLRGGLDAYFESWWQAQRRAWQDLGRDPRDEADRAARIFNVLAGARGPLTLEELARLAGVEHAAGLQERVNDLGRWIIATDTTSLGRSYAFAHPRLAEYWRDDKMSAGEHELVDQTLLDFCRSELARVRTGATDTGSPYALRHVAEHLERAGDARRLEELVSQGWMDARFTGDGYRYDGFLADLRIAWRAVHQEACRQIDDDLDPSAIAASFHCLLVHASILAQSAKYPPALLARLLETKVWDLDRVLSVAFRVTGDAQRVATLTALLDTGRLEPEAYDRARRDAVAGAARLTDSDCGRAVRRLASHLDGELLESAWGTLQHIRDKWHEVRAPAMAALAPRFSGARRVEALREALTGAFASSGDNRVEYSLPTLVPHLDPALLDEALALALASYELSPEAIAILAPHLDGAQRRRAVTEIRDVADRESSDSARARKLHWIAPLLEDEPTERALTGALSLENVHQRVAALSKLAPQLNEGQLKRAVAQALGIEDVHDDWSELLERVPDNLLEYLIPFMPSSDLLDDHVDRLLPTGTPPDPRVLGALGRHLHGELEARAMAALVDFSVSTSGYVADILATWADHLNEDQLEQSLKVVLKVDDPRGREAALVALVPRLSADALQRTLPALRGIDDEYERHGLALQICPGSEVSMFERILQPDFERAERTGALGRLAELGPSVPGPFRERVLELAERSDDDYGRAKLIRARAADLEGAAQECAVRVACAIATEDLRVGALTALIPHLRQDLLDHVLDAAEAVDTPGRARLMAALAPRLTGPPRRQACEEALARARPLNTFTEAHERADLLVSVAPALEHDIVEELLDEHWNYDARPFHMNVLVALAPKLTHGQLDQFIKPAWRPDDRARVLVAVAPHLSDSQLEEAVAAAPDKLYGSARATALAALAPRFTSRARSASLFYEALDALHKPLSGSTGLPPLAALAGSLPDELWQRGLDTAQAITEPGYRSCALALFLPTAPDPSRVIRLVRRAIAQHVFEELSDRSRPDLLRSWAGLQPDTLAPAWLDTPTLAAMASDVLEIDHDWTWP